MEPILSVSNLNKSFKGTNAFSLKKNQVLFDVSFEVLPKTITGFLGANGAGKTTSMKCMLDLIYKDSGDVSFFGSDKLTMEIRRKIGFLPERPYFYEYLTGNEFLKFYAKLSEMISGQELDDRIKFLLGRVGLGHVGNKQLRSYSKGMLQRIGIAQALIHNPEFVIFDEPMSGLDPDGRWEVNEIIKETAHNGTTVFFSSHLMNDAEKICENLIILKKGKMLYEGKANSFIGQFGLKHAVRYIKEGEELEVELDSQTKVQELIDKLRDQNLTILEVGQKKDSLEEAFVKTAIRD